MTYIPGGGGGGAGNIATSNDVALNNVTDGESLVYNQTLGKWTNTAVNSDLDDYVTLVEMEQSVGNTVGVPFASQYQIRAWNGTSYPDRDFRFFASLFLYGPDPALSTEVLNRDVWEPVGDNSPITPPVEGPGDPVDNPPATQPTLSLVYSTAADRSNPVALNGASTNGDIYVHLLPNDGLAKVEFFVDSVAYRTELTAPWDLMNNSTAAAAAPWQPTSGSRTVTARATLPDGTVMSSVTATFTAASTTPTPPPTQPPTGTYNPGPTGAAWPTAFMNTPAWNASPNATVSSLSALMSALNSATSGQVIHLNSMSLSGDIDFSSTNLKNISDTGTRVLVRPAPGATVTLSSVNLIRADKICLAGFRVNGSVHFKGGRFFAAARWRGTNTTSYYTKWDAFKHEYVEIVKPAAGGNGDSWQIKRDTGSKAPDTLLFNRVYLSGTIRVDSTHVDTLQVMGCAGTLEIRDSVFGMAGEGGGNIQAKAEGGTNGLVSGQSWVVIKRVRSFFGGAVSTGQGNSTNQSGSDIIVGCRFGKGDINATPRGDGSIPTGSQRLMINNTTSISDSFIDGSITFGNTYSGTKDKTKLGANNVENADLSVPVFVAPSWWNEV